nr:hypothetical protein [uncultured Xanthomonas sp.]
MNGHADVAGSGARKRRRRWRWPILIALSLLAVVALGPRVSVALPQVAAPAVPQDPLALQAWIDARERASRTWVGAQLRLQSDRKSVV